MNRSNSFAHSGLTVFVRLGVLLVLIVAMLGIVPPPPTRAATEPLNAPGASNPARPLAGYIDPATARRIAGLATTVSQVVGLSNQRIAMLHFSTNQVRVLNADGSQVYLTDLASALGTRATNRMTLKMYPIVNGELIVTVEGSSSGCDNNTNNLFAFLRLNASGAVATALTNISAATRAYNCYTDMAELSNGNLAFTYQINGDEYALRIFNPNGTAVTSEASIQKTGTGNGTCASQSAYSGVIDANDTGTFLITHHCYNNTNLYGTLYNNNGTQITVGAVQHFSIGTHTGSPNQAVMGLTDNNFMVPFNDGTNYKFKLVQPNGTISNAGSYTSSNYPSFQRLGDGGFIAIDSRTTNDGTYDYFYDFGTRYSNAGALINPATDFDTTYSDRCDIDWNCQSVMYVSTSTGYPRGILYVNGRTRELLLHNFGLPTAVQLSSFNARAPSFDLVAWFKQILGVR